MTFIGHHKYRHKFRTPEPEAQRQYSPTGSQMDSKRTVVTLRWPKPGEWGWIMSIHGSIYVEHYKYNVNFERFTGEIICEFLRHKDTTRCNAWIAEVDAKPVGSVMCTAAGNDPHAEEAKLRLLYVDPEVRGLGIGTKLVDECVRFARKAGYKKISLYTHSHLTAARKIYDSFGFRLVSSGHKHFEYGPELEDNFMELNLE